MLSIGLVVDTVAKTIIGNLIKSGYKKLTESDRNKYTQELYEIIIQTINSYEREFPIVETDKIPFYKSQVLIEQFLEFRFTKKLDTGKIKKIIEDDDRIIPPTQQEINNFFYKFNEAVNKSSRIKALDIDLNYKEEVFNIIQELRYLNDELINSVNEIREEIGSSKIANELYEEWNHQLDEIFEDIKGFKAITANKRLENLEKRIIENSIDNPKLFARLYYLKSQCCEQIGSVAAHDQQAKLLIRVYKLQPSNQIYKANAALSYFSLSELVIAKKIAQELIEFDEFNITGWVILCLEKGDDFVAFLNKIPVSVKKTNQFKIHLYRWLTYTNNIQKLSKLTELGLDFEIDFSKEVEFSYKTIHYQHLYATYLINKFYSENSFILQELSYPQAIKDEGYIYAFKILQASSVALNEAEIKSVYLYFEFQYHCCSYILFQDWTEIEKMEKVYESMSEKTLDVVVRMVQGYNSLHNEDATNKGIKVVESYTGVVNELLLILHAGNYAIIGDKEKQTEVFIKYINFNQVGDRFFILNFLSFVKYNGIENTINFQKSVLDFFESKIFVKEEYRCLLEIFCFLVFKIGYFTEDELKDKIEKLEVLIAPNDKQLTLHVAFAYCLTSQEDKAKNYLKDTLDFGEASEALKLFCKILYNGRGDKIELLNILKNWRENFSPDYEIFQMELELRLIQNNWKEAIKIAKKGVIVFPNSEYFLNGLFSALQKAIELEDIKKYAHLVQNKEFKEQAFAINIANALRRAGLNEESIELLYLHAVNKSNVQGRQAFLALSINYPDNLLKDYQIVDINSFIRYQIKGLSKAIHLTDKNKDSYPYKLFVGKRVGETFSIQRNFTDQLENVTILRITDKYIALLEEIIEEAKDPLSGMEIQSVDFGDGSADSIQRVLIEQFGTKGTLEKERIEKEYEKYYNGQISFSEITNSVFKRHFIDAYFLLSLNQGKPFMAISPAINPGSFPGDSKFVLDFTALCLFFQLAKECSMIFENKFVISSFMREIVVKNIDEIQTSTAPELSVSITMDKIIPYFYDDKFKERRLNTFESILKWIDENCVIEEVPETLNYIFDVGSKSQNSLFFNLLVDNRLLADRKGYVLLTNDTFYYRQLKGSPSNIVSPVCFLEIYQPQYRKEYIVFMLSCNYVGIPINSSLIKEEYFKMLSNQENRFATCLENLRYNWNPYNKHINEAINFVKELYVSSFINDKTRYQTASTVFQNLIVGMDIRLLAVIPHLIKKEFNLLGSMLFEVMQVFTACLSRR